MKLHLTTSIQEWWSQIGIDVEIVHHNTGLFFGDDPIDEAEYTYRRFFADAQMYANGPGINPQEYLSEAICDQITERENNWALGNIARACNAEYDAAFARLAKTPVGPERAELIKQLNDLYVQNYYELALINEA